MNDKSVQIVDNLLTLITITDMMQTGRHINEVHQSLVKHKYISEALKFLKLAQERKYPITLAHADWIKIIDLNERYKKSPLPGEDR